LWAEARTDEFGLRISNSRYADPTRRRTEEAAWRRIVRDGDRVLDCGCGTGFFIQRLRETLPDRHVEYHGLDLSSVALDFARRRLPDVPFVCAPAENMPYPDGHFDVVLIIAMLFESIDTANIFHEAARVLKPNGWLYVVVHKPFYDPFILPSVAIRLYQRLRHLPTESATIRPFRTRIAAECAAAGFRRVERQPLIHAYEWGFWLLATPFLKNALLRFGRVINRLPFSYCKNQEYWLLKNTGGAPQ
jgi:ubiquinone/menaquinone biosynthesis C-methylase UbiE